MALKGIQKFVGATYLSPQICECLAPMLTHPLLLRLGRNLVVGFSHLHDLLENSLYSYKIWDIWGQIEYLGNFEIQRISH